MMAWIIITTYSAKHQGYEYVNLKSKDDETLIVSSSSVSGLIICEVGSVIM